MLYTRKGDTGTTKLFGCTDRVAKDTDRIVALGTVDELNSFVGLARAHAHGDIHDELLCLQEDLFLVQAILAGAPKFFDDTRLMRLEAVVAKVEEEIPPIHSFTITGATVLSGLLDVARTIARRAERNVIAIHDDGLQPLIPYLNRLSSVLFALARLAAKRSGAKELSPSY